MQAPDKYSAVWVSYSSMTDFLRCPRAYYLKNIYRNPATGHKIKIASPPLSLGQTVHEVIDTLSYLPKEKRFDESLVLRFDELWNKVSGKFGGFTSDATEQQYKKRGQEMLERLMKNPGPLKNLAVKIKMDLPYYFLSEEANIILCGKIDWLEYQPESKSVHIIDFKTGNQDEGPDSLQLPTYCLLVTNCQKFPVAQASYWYLQRSDKPKEMPIPDLEEAKAKILDIAKKIKTARQLNVFKCPHQTGCVSCRGHEAVVAGRAEFVGTNSFNEDVYIFEKSPQSAEETTIIL